MELSPQVLDIFIEKIISFESNTLLYKKTLKILSLVLSLKENSLEIIKAFNLTSNNQKALLYQAYCLANTKLDIQITEEVLKISSKERRTMWAK